MKHQKKFKQEMALLASVIQILIFLLISFLKYLIFKYGLPTNESSINSQCSGKIIMILPKIYGQIYVQGCISLLFMVEESVEIF